MRLNFLIVFILTGSLSLLYGRHRAVPLLPVESKTVELASATDISTSKSENLSNTAFGVELGLLGDSGGTGSDLLGTQLLVGGRFYSFFQITQNIYLKPSLGFYTRQETGAGYTLYKNNFEGGLSIDYALLKTDSTLLYFGMSNFLDAYYTWLSLANATTTSPLTLRYRVGPCLGGEFKLSEQFSLRSELSYSFAFMKPLRQFAGFGIGIGFSF